MTLFSTTKANLPSWVKNRHQSGQWRPESAETSSGKADSSPSSCSTTRANDPSSYGPNGERLVSGVVPLSPDHTHVLLIQSSSRKNWVLPKGGWETDERTAEDAACREAWEEAGIECAIEKDLGTIEEKRSEAQIAKNPHAPRAAYRFYEVRVVEEKSSWPESHKRRREWMSYGKAKELLRDRAELMEALERSSIKR